MWWVPNQESVHFLASWSIRLEELRHNEVSTTTPDHVIVIPITFYIRKGRHEHAAVVVEPETIVIFGGGYEPVIFTGEFVPSK